METNLEGIPHFPADPDRSKCLLLQHNLNSIILLATPLAPSPSDLWAHFLNKPLNPSPRALHWEDLKQDRGLPDLTQPSTGCRSSMKPDASYLKRFLFFWPSHNQCSYVTVHDVSLYYLWFWIDTHDFTILFLLAWVCWLLWKILLAGCALVILWIPPRNKIPILINLPTVETWDPLDFSR